MIHYCLTPKLFMVDDSHNSEKQNSKTSIVKHPKQELLTARGDGDNSEKQNTSKVGKASTDCNYVILSLDQLQLLQQQLSQMKIPLTINVSFGDQDEKNSSDDNYNSDNTDVTDSKSKKGDSDDNETHAPSFTLCGRRYQDLTSYGSGFGSRDHESTPDFATFHAKEYRKSLDVTLFPNNNNNVAS